MTTNGFQPGARVPLLDPESARVAAAAVGMPVEACELNVFRALLHDPPVAKRCYQLIAQQIFGGVLDDRLRELVIMRVGWRTGSVYEWAQHWQIAPGFGCTEGELLGVRDWRAHDGFGPVERAVLAATDDVLESGAVTATTWEACERALASPAELVELVTTIGTWHMVSAVLRSLAVPLEDGIEAWPPDGEAPWTPDGAPPLGPSA